MAHASGAANVTFLPEEGVSVTVRVDGFGKGFDVEWRDVRCLPSSSDADVSRNSTPRAHTESIRNVQGLVKVLHKIVFGDEPSLCPLDGAAETGNYSNSNESSVMLHLQDKTNRGKIMRMQLVTDAQGTFQRSTLLGGYEKVEVDKTPHEMLMRLQDLLSAKKGMILVRPVAWNELPSELWYNVLKCLTKKDGRASACASQTFVSIVRNASFAWALSLMHISLVTAQDAVRLDNSTHLPVNITEGEIRIGRSRRNDVVLLRDPEVSKKHCRIWRDSKGEMYIQDLASTNGTKLNGDWLRPRSDTGPDSRSHSDPRVLSVGDVVMLGLTTLKLYDGPAPELPKTTLLSEDGDVNTPIAALDNSDSSVTRP